jgi:tRNA (guanosine-2'-O-)-methyltransferase
LALLLEDVQGPFNVGSICRTAAAYTVDHLWLVGHTANPNDAKTQKTALGTTRYLQWDRVDGVGTAVAAARDGGYRVVGIELAEGALPLHEITLADDVCLAVGHEDRGLSKAALAACDELAYLPMLGRVGSLNVATATAMAVYEVRRRHWGR